jgi:hypothetical protein
LGEREAADGGTCGYNRFSPTILDYTENMAKSSKSVIPKKRGRPATGRDPLIAFRLPPETIAALTAWAARQLDNPSRSEALRRLIDLGMKAPTGRKR